MFKNYRFIHHTLFYLCILFNSHAGATDDLRDFNHSHPQRPKENISRKRKPVDQLSTYPKKRQKGQIYLLFKDLENHFQIDKLNNRLIFRHALEELKEFKYQLSPQTKGKLNWYEGYYLTHSTNDLEIFEGLKLLTHTPKAHPFHTSLHHEVVRRGYQRLCQCLMTDRDSPNHPQYGYIVDYLNFMSGIYPDFLISDYDFQDLEKTFTDIKHLHPYTYSEILEGLEQFSKDVNTDKLAEYIVRFPESSWNKNGVEISNTYFSKLFRLLLEPVHKIVREQNPKITRHNRPHFVTNAIPVPQQSTVICDSTIPLATGDVWDCVALYAYTPTTHGLVHYDRYCQPSDLQTFLSDLQKANHGGSPLSCHLLTTRFTTQLQDIYEFLKKQGIQHIDITVAYPNHFFSQQDNKNRRKKKDYYTNFYDGEIPKNYHSIHVTCQQGTVTHGVTRNSIVSEEMTKLRLQNFYTVVYNYHNRPYTYLDNFSKVFKSRYKGIETRKSTSNLKYLY